LENESLFEVDGGAATAPLSRAARSVREAMRFRVALVQASAGWGKTSAVRAAVGGLEHIWLDLTVAPRESGAFAFALATTLGISTAPIGRVLSSAREAASAAPVLDWIASHRPDLRLVVVDDLHLLADDPLSLDVIVGLIKMAPHVRWVLVSRHALPLPVATWMAYGDAAMPVGEESLGLEGSELRRLLAERGLRADVASITAIQRVTGGWPVAAQFFLRAAESGGDLPAVTASTKETAFAYLADQIVATLPAGRLDVLRTIAFAGTSDVRFLESLGLHDAQREVAWLRSAPVPLVKIPGGFRLHDLFAEYLRRTTPREDLPTIAGDLVRTLLAEKRVGDAVDVARVNAPNLLTKILSVHGFRLLDEGRYETAEQAVAILPAEARQRDPGIVGLRAALEAFSGGLDRAADLYRRAIDLSTDPDMRSLLSRRLSLILINRAGTGARDILEPVLDVGDERSRCEARSVYAVALAMMGEADASVRELRAALEVAERLAEDALVAKILMRLAWAYFHLAKPLESERHARDSARLAERCGEWGTYADAHSMLCSAASVYGDDVPQAIWHAQQLVVGATRAGDRQRRSLGLWAQYDFEVDRGRRDRVESLERELEATPYGYRDGLMARTSQAIRLGWDGSFAAAVSGLQSLNGTIANPAETRCWHATLAMFEAFAGRTEAAKASVAAAGRRTACPASDVVFHVIADLHLALAEIFVGRPSLAARRIPRDCSRSIDKALAAAVRLLAAQTNLDANSIANANAILRGAGRDGFADLLEVAVGKRQVAGTVGALTDAETTALRGLADGLTARQIAAGSARSYETIRSHLKSASRKLGVSSQIELIATARRLGILD
jgi:ATP/maltotriose-dependent transcriptional regulator MalT